MLRSVRSLAPLARSTIARSIPLARRLPQSRNIHEISRPAVETPLSLWNFTEEEEMLRESVRRFAQDVIGPKVSEMDEKEVMDPAIIKGLFENGVSDRLPKSCITWLTTSS